VMVRTLLLAMRSSMSLKPGRSVTASVPFTAGS
jgi:hypothetical protein